MPTGTITFRDNGTNIAGCVGLALDSAEQAVCPTQLKGGHHILTAQYSGDANFNPATCTLAQDIYYYLILPEIQKH